MICLLKMVIFIRNMVVSTCEKAAKLPENRDLLKEFKGLAIYPPVNLKLQPGNCQF